MTGAHDHSARHAAERPIDSTAFSGGIASQTAAPADAAARFAMDHGQRHARDRATGACFRCGGESPQWLLEFQWMNVRSSLTPQGLANIIRVLNLVPASANDEVVRRTGTGFRTFHPACDACRRRLGRRRTCVKICMTLLATIAVVGFGVSLVAALALLGTTALPGSDEHVAIVRAAWTGTPIAVLALLCLTLMKPMTVPRALRHLSRRPFRDNAAIFFPFGSSVEVPLLIRHKYKTLTFTDAELRTLAQGGDSFTSPSPQP